MIDLMLEHRSYIGDAEEIGLTKSQARFAKQRYDDGMLSITHNRRVDRAVVGTAIKDFAMISSQFSH